MVITFDKELRLKHIKKESYSKRGKECDDQYLKGIGDPKFLKFYLYY